MPKSSVGVRSGQAREGQERLRTRTGNTQTYVRNVHWFTSYQAEVTWFASEHGASTCDRSHHVLGYFGGGVQAQKHSGGRWLHDMPRAQIGV